MSYLLDTNVISELRKRDRMHTNVSAWFTIVDESEIFLSVLVIGELRKGIENIRRRDPDSAIHLDQWLRMLVEIHQERILPIDREIAEEWGRLSVPDPISTVDGLLAATAKKNQLILVTRNTADVARTGCAVLNPFEPLV